MRRPISSLQSGRHASSSRVSGAGFFFARKASLSPLLVGVADQGLNAYCAEAAVPAAAISPELDVWTYARKEKVAQQYEIKTKWK